MLITCGSCDKQFKIPEEKVPDVPKFFLKCPECGEKILVNREESQEKSQKLLESFTVEPEMHPPGSMVAFVYLRDKDLFEKIAACLKEKGYIVSSAKNIEEAVAKLGLNRYNLVIFEEGQGGKLLEEIDKWPGNVRRNINVVAIGEKAKTFDPNIEFILGVNSYISMEDLNRLNEILDNVFKRYEDFLTPWKFVSNDD